MSRAASRSARFCLRIHVPPSLLCWRRHLLVSVTHLYSPSPEVRCRATDTPTLLAKAWVLISGLRWAIITEPPKICISIPSSMLRLTNRSTTTRNSGDLRWPGRDTSHPGVIKHGGGPGGRPWLLHRQRASFRLCCQPSHRRSVAVVAASSSEFLAFRSSLRQTTHRLRQTARGLLAPTGSRRRAVLA
jgi:hypothetical protein